MTDAPTYTAPKAQRGLGIQFLIAFSYGLTSVLLFSFWRRKYKFIYQARAVRETAPPRLSSSYFGWIRDLILVTDEQLSRSAGLDAYVFITFFRASIALLFKLSLVSLFFIAPLRWFYLGQFGDSDNMALDGDDDQKSPNLFGNYIWVYAASTYIFTFICVKTMQEYSQEVVCIRQRYLGHQKSITDRTLQITGIPRRLRDTQALNEYFSLLFKVKPEKIVLCRNWSILDKLFSRRHKILEKLEEQWARYVGVNNPEFLSLVKHEDVEGLRVFLDERNGLRRGRRKLFGPVIDLVSYYEHQLAVVDTQIEEAQATADAQRVTSTAFITMREASDCQMAAQALLSPTPHVMVSALAPAPNDVIWRNVYLKPKVRLLYSYLISLVVLLCSVFLVVPLTYLSRFLDIDIIREHFPKFADWLANNKWMATIVTDVLPAYAFVILNQIVPFFYAWLSQHQGFVSSGDVELSTVGKNFFYVFVNLFVIFTIESTFFSFSVDTTEFAKEFAYWLLRLSSFYANFIILQGVGITPLRLLQPVSLLRYYVGKLAIRTTAREVHDRFEPERINYGLMLPTPLLIFILVLTYSIVRRWILFFGLVYFVISYLVYKYQLLYTMVHPQHSNARLWTAILRRVYLGLGVFHLAMIGVLVLQSEYAFACSIIPLTVSLFGFWYDFEKYTKPLLECVAIEALHQSELDQKNIGTSTNHLDMFGDTDSDNESAQPDDTSRTESSGMRNDSEPGSPEVTSLNILTPESIEQLSSQNPDWTEATTLDEDREKDVKYTNENLLNQCEGPWVATDGKYRIVKTEIGFLRTRISYRKWF